MLAYDPFPSDDKSINYVSFEELVESADIISLHCPLTKDTYHMIDSEVLERTKQGVMIINTSRGALINAEALIESLKNHHVGSVGLDVYEEESELFFEDFSGDILEDDVLARLLSMPNVLVTGHQAFLTREALANISFTTLSNLKEFFDGGPLKNEVCYSCIKFNTCDFSHSERCF